MSDDPGDTGFGVSDQGVLDFAAWLGDAESLVNAFPAALLAPVWRALLEADVVETPARVDTDRVEVLLVGPNQLELRVPVRSRYAEFVKVVPVWVGKWLANGEAREPDRRRGEAPGQRAGARRLEPRLRAQPRSGPEAPQLTREGSRSRDFPDATGVGAPVACGPWRRRWSWRRSKSCSRSRGIRS